MADHSFCTSCGTCNRPGAKVCAHCGRPLVQVCLRCRQANRQSARFCRQCGVALAPALQNGSSQPAHPQLGQAGQMQAAAAAFSSPGSLLNGRYTVQRLLAKGGMGSVYQVADERQPGTVWALKEMDLAEIDPVEQQEAIIDFRREAALLRTLDHRNLVKVVDHFSAGLKEYLVMECVQGETLDAHLRRQQRSETAVLPIALQLCDVLDYLHTRTPPIIYRDLKPSNVMIEPASGLVKLIDFGIARFYKPGKQKDTKMLGTPGFAPPEQYGDGQTDARSDIFALGVTLHVLLTDYDVEQTPWNYPPVTTLNPQVSQAMERVIAQATEMQVVMRYQRVAEMRDALLACQAA